MKLNSKMCVTVLKQQHHTLLNIGQHGYKGIYEWSKVRYMKYEINISNLNSVKDSILYSDYYLSNFDGIIILYKYFIQQSGGQLDFKVAGLETGKVGGGGCIVVGSNKVPDK